MNVSVSGYRHISRNYSRYWQKAPTAQAGDFASKLYERIKREMINSRDSLLGDWAHGFLKSRYFSALTALCKVDKKDGLLG